MGKPRIGAGGGFAAIGYTLRMGRKAGGLGKLYRRLRSHNACKTCALGMGGQRGGMINEAGHFPSVCKKSMQAQASDMAGPIDAELFHYTPIEQLRGLSPRQLDALGRLAFPLISEPGGTHFRRATLEEAVSRAAAALRTADPRRVFFYVSGRSSNEAAFLLQLVARAYGCPHVHNCSYYCHSASGVALARVYGSGTASVVLEDLARTDLVAVIGSNPASNHPRLVTELVGVRKRGGKVIAINPLRELGLDRFRIPSDPGSLIFGSKVSDLYLQPRTGTDIALFKAVLQGLDERGAIDAAFVAEHTRGWDEVRADLAGVATDDLLAICGVSRAARDAMVAMLAGARLGIFAWAMGLTHQERGVDAILALSNLALARGWLGRPGAGLLPIRGHSNVQGIGSMGVSPSVRATFAAKLEALYGVAPLTGGDTTFQSMQAAADGRVDVAVLFGGNLFSANPSRVWSRDALSRIGTIIQVSTTLNEGHVHPHGPAKIVFPALARDEEPQPTTQESMFNFVRLSDGGEPNLDGEMQSEVAIVAALAERILPPDRFEWSQLRSHEHLRAQIAQVVPGYGPIGAMGETREEFQIPGRTFHAPAFATDDGRARFHVVSHEGLAVEHGTLRLMTVRSEGQFNTVVYEEEDLYRGNLSRDVVMLSRADAAGIGAAEGDAVVVESETGSMTVRVAVVDIAPGSAAMYYPEANVLVPARIDAQSGTPPFKSVAVRIRKVAGALA